MTRPNFVLFNPDEWRADCAGCYGDTVVETPNLDALAARGVRFDQAHVQHTVCSPSRCSFMTGWYPHVRGHRTLWNLLRPDEPNLLKYLKRAGYDVRWFGKNDLLAPGSFAESVTEARTLRQGHPSHNPWPREDPRYFSFLYGSGGDARHDGDFLNLEAGLRFLREPHAEPFCLYLPLSNPHCPYTAPRGFHDRYDPDALPPLRPPVDDEKPSYHRLIRRSRRLDELDTRVFDEIRAVYLGMITYADWLLGELLRTLEETGLSDNTFVVAFSDHGDWAGDYGLVEKWPSALDDTLTRVPFVVAGPGVERQVVPDIVELIDLTPTVLDLAGIELTHTQFGRSLVPQLQGESGDPERAAFAEGGYDPHEPHCFEGHAGGDQFGRDPGHIYWPKMTLQQREPLSVCRSAMVRTATHKLVRRPLDRSELYDLRADPGELRNLYADPGHEGVRRELETRLLDWYVHTSDVVPWDENPRGFTDAALPSAGTPG